MRFQRRKSIEIPCKAVRGLSDTKLPFSLGRSIRAGKRLRGYCAWALKRRGKLTRVKSSAPSLNKVLTLSALLRLRLTARGLPF